VDALDIEGENPRDSPLNYEHLDIAISESLSSSPTIFLSHEKQLMQVSLTTRFKRGKFSSKVP